MTECKTDRFEDYFTLGKQLGSGGYGTVFAAQPTDKASAELGIDLPPVVAVKVITMRQRPRRGVTVEDFDNEVQALKSIDSEYVLKYYGCWATTDGNLIKKAYYVMEFVEGMDAFAFLEQGGKLPKHIVSKIILGLKAIHKAGMAHRDIKLENIMISYRGAVKIVDFGASCSMTKRCDSDPSATGTQGYQDPLLMYYAKRHSDAFREASNKQLLQQYQLADYISLMIAVATLQYGDYISFLLHDVVDFDESMYTPLASSYVGTAPYSYEALSSFHDRLIGYMVNSPYLTDADKASLVYRADVHRKNYKTLLREAVMDTDLPAPMTRETIQRALRQPQQQQPQRKRAPRASSLD